MAEATFSELVGKTLVSIDGGVGDEEIVLRCSDSTGYIMYHRQDCCESVTVEDICGDISDLIGAPVISAEEVISENENPEGVKPPKYQDSFTWTFYRIATAKGMVVIRWYGESNGYYSESVDFERLAHA